MSLIERMMEECIFLNVDDADDPYGSTKPVSQDGDPFSATIIKNATTEAIVAEQGEKPIYTVVTPRSVVLDYHDVFRRVSDGQVFRVTSHSKDSEAPAQSTVPIAKVTAEEWEVT